MPISYQELRKISPSFAREKVLETFKNTGSIRKTARIWKASRNTIRAILKRAAAGRGLEDLSRRPKISPNKTPPYKEQMVIRAHKKTGYGAKRLRRVLLEQGIELSVWTIRNILKRNNLKPRRRRTYKGLTRPYYPWEHMRAFELLQTDLKEILDMKSLPPDVYRHHESNGLPLYQWTACCVRTRVRFIAYSMEKSFSNGIAFIILVVLWLRAHGVKGRVYIQTDWGEEFAGKSERKIKHIQERILEPMNAQLLRIRKGKATDNAVVERSHRTDDEEFYIPKLLSIPDTERFLYQALLWTASYNLKRAHYGRGMDGLTPYEKLISVAPGIGKRICMFPAFLLDRVIPIYRYLTIVKRMGKIKRVGQHVQAYYKFSLHNPQLNFINSGLEI